MPKCILVKEKNIKYLMIKNLLYENWKNYLMHTFPILEIINLIV